MSFAAILESVDNVLPSAYDRPKRLAKIFKGLLIFVIGKNNRV